MSDIPENLRYTEEHEWIRIEDGVAVIGITDYAQDALTDIVWIEFLADEGDSVEDNGTFASDVVLDGGTLECAGQPSLLGAVSQQAASKIKLGGDAVLTTTQAVGLGSTVLSLEGPGTFSNNQPLSLIHI